MTSTTPETPEPYTWLPSSVLLAWLQLSDLPETDARRTAVELCRRAAASWCEDQRRDLVGLVDDVPTFVATDRVQMAGVLAAARLYARRSSPAGLAEYAELGAAGILRTDPDVALYLGTGRHSTPLVG